MLSQLLGPETPGSPMTGLGSPEDARAKQSKATREVRETTNARSNLVAVRLHVRLRKLGLLCGAVGTGASLVQLFFSLNRSHRFFDP